jgi:RNA polymerase sigma-70 factor (ECF subfamily)
MSVKDSHPDCYYVKNYINGHEESLKVLLERHEQRIFNFIYSKVYDREITNDIFQDTFIKVIKTLKKGKYNEQGKFLPWVMRIAHNLIIDFFRKNNRMPKFENTGDFDIFSVLENDELNIEGSLIKSQVETDVVFLLKHLPQEQQEVIEMRIFKGMSFKEIAEDSNVSINTALGRMRYALINLRKLIQEKNISVSIQ